MPQVRTKLEHDEALPALDLARTAFLRLHSDLSLGWANPAFIDGFAPTHGGWQAAPLAALDAGTGELAAAAQRALAEGHGIVLHRVLVRGAAGTSQPANVSLSALPDGGLLLELQGLVNAGDAATPALSESLRGFAHEVKNPLAGVRGAAQLLARRVPSDDLRELAQLIMDESDRLALLADRLLRAGGKPRLVRLNVHEVLERVALLMRAESAGLALRRDYDPSLPAVTGDADRLHQLLLNLTRNAIEAGANELVLRTRLRFGERLHERLRRAVLCVEVGDNGRGIAPELAATLYQPLVSGRADGSGLGLALAREIAHEHGGELRHQSVPGATTFSLLLPVELSA